MGKRRRKSKVPNLDGKSKPIKDPSPNSEEYIYDAVDKFHESKDKILLDPSREEEESEIEENLDEEVLAIEGDSSSSEDFSDNNDDGDEEDDDERGELDEQNVSSDEFEDNIEIALPSDKAWGKNKKTFYDVDIPDEDESDEEAEMAIAEEEEEAIHLQKRLTEKLDVEDFDTFDENIIEGVEEEKVSITKDLLKLSKKEKLHILAKESPELLPLLEEYKEKLNDVKDTYHPLMLMSRKGLISNPEGVKFIQMKHQLLLNYLVNISFYLALKSSKDNTKGHPVIDVLVQHQQLLSQMKPVDEKLAPEIKETLAKYKDNIKEGFTALKSKDENKKVMRLKTLRDELKDVRIKRKKPEVVADLNTDIDPLEYYNLIKAQHEKEKTTKKQKLSDTEVEDGNEVLEDGKRIITYEMSKNKGLIRKRRKELKNPRVKHKMKFKKAIIKRKGQVREVQNESNWYGGELTGIKSTLTRSTKIR